MILTGKTIVSAIRPPYPYGGEFVQQFLFALRLCWFPLMISTIAFGYAAPGLQASNFLTLFGANDRLGGFFVLASIREFAPFVTAIVLAGVAGTAITADLGARKIREELDALQVLGVDPVKNLVVPRFLALMLVTGMFDVFARAVRHLRRPRRQRRQPAAGRPVLRQPADQREHPGPLGQRPEVHAVRRDHRRRLLLQGHDGVRRRRGRGPRRQPGRRHLDARRVRVQLRVHADAAGHPPRHPQHQVNGWLAVPRDWLATFGDIVRFSGRVVGEVFGLKVFRYFGEALRQAGVLILSSTLVIWGLTFIIGLQCGIEAAYFNRADRRPRLRGRVRRLVRPARADPLRVRLHDVRQGRHRHRRRARLDADLRRDRRARGDGHLLDDLPVRDPPDRGLARAARSSTWPASAPASWPRYLAVVEQIGEVSSGGYSLIFWMFQNPPDLLFSLIKAMVMATVIVLVGCYYGYTASGGPVGVGTATAKSMVLNIVLVHLIGMLGTQVFWGANPRAPIGG